MPDLDVRVSGVARSPLPRASLFLPVRVELGVVQNGQVPAWGELNNTHLYSTVQTFQDIVGLVIQSHSL